MLSIAHLGNLLFFLSSRSPCCCPSSLFPFCPPKTTNSTPRWEREYSAPGRDRCRSRSPRRSARPRPNGPWQSPPRPWYRRHPSRRRWRPCPGLPRSPHCKASGTLSTGRSKRGSARRTRYRSLRLRERLRVAIQLLPGEDSRELARRVADEIERSQQQGRKEGRFDAF